MPKTPMDYSKTNIYKIVCNNLSIKESYVGHTTDMTKRKCSHKSSCNNEKDRGHNYKIYKIIRENGGWDNWNMVLVEKFPCKDKYEACKREREVFEELDAKLNMVRPYRTHEEHNQYREEHKTEIAERMKQYREEHKEDIKQYREEHKAEIKQYYLEHKAEIAEKNKAKIECEYCAKLLSKGSMYHHLKICKSKPVKE